MYALIGVAFCILLGVMLKHQGVLALLWTPLGFVAGLIATAQIVLPLLMGLPRANSLISMRQMRSQVYGRIVVMPIIWLGVLVLFYMLWPTATEVISDNTALMLGALLGAIATGLSTLSEKGRSDFVVDFDRSYEVFRIAPTPKETLSVLKERQQRTTKVEIKVAGQLFVRPIGASGAALLATTPDLVDLSPPAFARANERQFAKIRSQHEKMRALPERFQQFTTELSARVLIEKQAFWNKERPEEHTYYFLPSGSVSTAQTPDDGLVYLASLTELEMLDADRFTVDEFGLLQEKEEG